MHHTNTAVVIKQYQIIAILGSRVFLAFLFPPDKIRVYYKKPAEADWKTTFQSVLTRFL